MSQKSPARKVERTSPAADRPPAAAAPQVRPGWRPAEHEGLPQPTYWPVVMAFGIALLAWGLVTTLLVSGVGLVMFALALAGWIGELRHGH